VIKFIKKLLTHNRCDICGLTEDDVYHIGNYISSCGKCIVDMEKKEKKIKRSDKLKKVIRNI